MSSSCVEEIKSHAGGVPIRHALDCITDADSTATCFAALGRTGGRYACLEELREAWRTRHALKVKVVMGYEIQGEHVELGHDVYTRRANAAMQACGMTWATGIRELLAVGAIMSPPTREIEGGFQGIIAGLKMLQAGDVRGGKIVVRLSGW